MDWPEIELAIGRRKERLHSFFGVRLNLPIVPLNLDQVAVRLAPPPTSLWSIWRQKNGYFEPDFWKKVKNFVQPTIYKNENDFFSYLLKKEHKNSIPNNSKQKENGFISTCGRNKFIKNPAAFPFNKLKALNIILLALLLGNVAVCAYENTSVGMVCSDTSDCTKYCGGHVICSLRQCNCVNGSLFDEDNYGCFKSIHDLHGQECCYDEDCRIFGAICREETKRKDVFKTCQCPEDHIFIENKCVQIKERCSSKDDCEKHAHCVKLHHSINLGVCECNHGYIYNNGSCVKQHIQEIIQECVDKTPPFCEINEIYCKSERHNYGACKYDYKNKKNILGEMCITTEECLAEDKFSICKNRFCDCMPGYKNESGKCLPNLIGLPCSSKHRCLVPNSKCDHVEKICLCKNGSLFDGQNCINKNVFSEHSEKTLHRVDIQYEDQLEPKSYYSHTYKEDNIKRSGFYSPASNKGGKIKNFLISLYLLISFAIVLASDNKILHF